LTQAVAFTYIVGDVCLARALVVGAAAERVAVRVAEAGLVGYIGYWAAVAVVAGAVY